MNYETDKWRSPNTINEMIEYLKTLPEDTKINFEIRLLTVVNDDKSKNYELQKREKDFV